MLDWDDLRYFLAIARHGNLTAAAAELRVAPSTIGRRLSSLEGALSARLLNRTPDGYHLTLAGEEVRAKAEHLEAETRSLQRSVGNRDEQLSGMVRVTCSESMASHVIAPCLSLFHDYFPGITVDLLPTPQHLSLSMREADIAVRLNAPKQEDVVGRRIGSMKFRAYASVDYIFSRGQPDFGRGCVGHRAVRQTGDIQAGGSAEWFNEATTNASTAVQTCSHEAALTATAGNAGIACLARLRANLEANLMELSTPSHPPASEIWLVLHKDNRHTARIRATADHIAQHVKTLEHSL